MKRITSFVALSLAACAARSTPAPVAARPPANATNPATWVNPGGMWLPEQMPQQAEVLRSLGLEIPAAQLADRTKAPLGAMVSLGGCSAAFVSRDGLIATNHHCVQTALAINSTPDANLIEEGFVARTRADEKWGGPTAHAYVVTGTRDVTKEMTEGLDKIADDAARHVAVEEREGRLLAECERGRPELRCNLVSDFGGGSWRLIEQIDLRDVRLVYAPQRAVGNYGGEVDNWMWPRHSGDFALLRAYVGKDGKPADHADENVPYRPAHFVSPATTPLREGDLILVAGNPGTTKRLSTAAQVELAADWYFPRELERLAQQLAVVEEARKGKPELAIKSEPAVRGLKNYLKKNKGVLETLRGGLVQQRRAEEAKLAAWIDSDATRRARYGGAVEKIAAIETARKETRELDAAIKELSEQPKLLAQALTIVRLAEERTKPDATRRLEYQERNWKRLEQASRALRRSYARPVDRAVLKLFVERAAGVKAAAALGTGGALETRLDALYAGTKLEDLDARLVLMRQATPAQLAASKDPFIVLARELLPEVLAWEARQDGYEGALLLAASKHVAALREMRGTPLAPDANGTLRWTYGRVLPPPAGGAAFTSISQMAAKNTGEEPFDVPSNVLAAVEAKKWGAYGAPELGELPVDFMSDADITNGSSGSPTLNARGELVGVAFDGVLDTVASDWLYMLDKSRTIHADLRYILWMMDAVDNADHLLTEMGVKPSL